MMHGQRMVGGIPMLVLLLLVVGVGVEGRVCMVLVGVHPSMVTHALAAR
jgi:hypothetical protein